MCEKPDNRATIHTSTRQKDAHYRQVSDENTSVWRSHLLTTEREMNAGLFKADLKPLVRTRVAELRQPFIKALSYISSSVFTAVFSSLSRSREFGTLMYAALCVCVREWKGLITTPLDHLHKG